jgi:4-hydroxybenzoate polyprenyltransferase
MRLARVSNLPTTWTNVLLGAVLATRQPDVDGLVVAAAVTGLMYVGGMILNDAVDAPRDRERGLDRPIAAGRVSRRAAWLVAVGMLLAGPLLTLAAAGPGAAAAWAAGLAACVVAYDLLKERGRGLILPLAASLQGGAGGGRGGDAAVAVAVAAVGLAAYVTLVTIAARGEHGDGGDGPARRRTSAARLLVFAPIITAAGVLAAAGWPEMPWLAAGVLMMAVAVMWIAAATRSLAAGGSVPASVMRWLAAICLVDAAILLLVAAPVAWPVLAVACFAVTRRAHRRIAGS